jgi:hypothetical protein
MRWVCGHIFAQNKSGYVRSGKYSANITVFPGDIEEEGESERDELDSGKFSTMNQTVYYGW